MARRGGEGEEVVVTEPMDCRRGGGGRR